MYALPESSELVLIRDDRTRQYFDERARGYYDRNYAQPKNRHALNLALRRDATLQLLPTEQSLILDLGCGPGALTIPLVGMGHRVVAVDLSQEMIRDTSRHLQDLGATPCVAVADVVALPFADCTFSAIVTTGVLEYVEDLPRAMHEIARVLDHGGALIATMSLPRRLERGAMRLISRLRGSPAQASQYIYGRSAFDKVVESPGLKIDASRCCGFAPFPLDALIPASVRWIDTAFGSSLNRVAFAKDNAKTYIVRARKA